MRLFRGASSLRKQLAGTEGVVGFSLLARPLRKQYATLSIWVDEDALAAFTDRSPHRQLMADLSAEMGATKFVRWTMAGSDRPLLAGSVEATECQAGGLPG
jgi:heme-degrading monooxygenase HmoA